MSHKDEFIPDPKIPETLEDVAEFHDSAAETQEQFAGSGDFAPEAFDRRFQKSAEAHREAADLIRRNRVWIGGVSESERKDARVAASTLLVSSLLLGVVVGRSVAELAPPVEGWSVWMGLLIVASFFGGFFYAAWVDLTDFIESIPSK